MLNVHFTGLAIIGLALLLIQLIPVSAQLTFPLFTAPSSYSLIRRFAPRLSSISINKRRRNSLVNNLLIDSEHQQRQNLFNNLTKISNYHQNPYYEFYLNQLSPQQSTDQTQNEFVNNLLPVNIHNLPATIELINSHLNNQFNNHQFNNDLNQLSSDRIENRLDNQLERINQNNEFNHQLINNQFNNPHYLNRQSILINHHHPIQTIYSQPSTHFYLHQPSHLINHPHLHHLTQQQQQNLIDHGQSLKNYKKSIVNQTPSYSLLNKVQHLKQKLKQQKIKLRQTKLLDYQLSQLKQLTKLNAFKKKINNNNNELTTLNPLNEQLTTTSSSQLARTGYLEIGSTAHLNEFSLETDESDQTQYLDNNNLEDQLIDNEEINNKEPTNKIINKLNDTLLINNNNKTTTGNVNNNNQQLQPTVTSLIKTDLENLLKQFKPTNFIQLTQQNLDHQLELKSKYAYDLIGTNSTNNNHNFNQNVQVDFRERTAPDISAGIFSRALGSLTNYLPNSMKITRTSGCVGGTRCQFFLSCWISSGSLGSSCGPLSTCCITPYIIIEKSYDFLCNFGLKLVNFRVKPFGTRKKNFNISNEFKGCVKYTKPVHFENNGCFIRFSVKNFVASFYNGQICKLCQKKILSKNTNYNLKNVDEEHYQGVTLVHVRKHKECGRSATRISRIVGGMDASFGQFPWQAFVQVGGSRCGGALVGVKHVVTAGHCVARSQHNPSDIRVTLGDYILNSDIESLPHEVFTVAEVRLHPNFRFTPQADRYDVAVLILDRNVQYRNNIKPICLPQKDANYLGRVAFVAGWGALSAGSKLRPKVLQHVNVPVIDNNVCEIWHRKRGINIKIHDEMICAGYQAGNKDACQGDSGGPLMLNEFGVWYLIGIVSAGYSCAKSYQPGIYHRVSSSSDWVSSAIYSQSQNN